MKLLWPVDGWPGCNWFGNRDDATHELHHVHSLALYVDD
jgi:hypothetical protein